jgi:hypothetical protein
MRAPASCDQAGATGNRVRLPSRIGARRVSQRVARWQSPGRCLITLLIQ